eukprot:CAMPEP_0180174266 /NCGR_PEP_ID=MMETSP0986-20121125/36050_1 /TAXON_ID=697907 /ORGANISM="non described non described, Strain CCMP2293" /LENGTH=266 /DNA_ID=CAMNT_0022126575 /DNA_START=180 /DNA_END=976 /DNA_ORIENTATION=-
MSQKKDTDAVGDALTTRWGKLARTPKVVPAPEAGSGAPQAYHVRFADLKQVSVPKFLLAKADDVAKFKVRVVVSATLFHTKSKSFFGSTWTGKGLDLKAIAKRSGVGGKWNGVDAEACDLDLGADYGFLFHSTLPLDAFVVSVEVQLAVMNATETIRGEEYGVQWAVLTLKAAKDVAAAVASEPCETAALLAGSPRLLLFVGADAAGLEKAKVKDAKMGYVSYRHAAMDEVAAATLDAHQLWGGPERDSLGAAVPGLDQESLGSGA